MASEAKAKVSDMQIKPDGSAVFKTVDGITVKVSFESPTRVSVEMVRDSELRRMRVTSN